MKKIYFIAFLLGLILLPACVSYPILPKTELQKIQLAQVAIVGKITAVNAGIQTMMNPPTVHLSISLESPDVLAGENFKTKSIKLLYTGYEWSEKVQIGKTYVFLGTQSEGYTTFDDFFPITSKQLIQIKKLLKSEVTLPPEIEFSVTQVKAEKEYEYQNPFGDGKFKIKLYNNSDKTAFIPVVKDENGHINWEKSVKISIDNKILTEIPTRYEVVELPPKRVIEGVINTLYLKGVQWPNGGSRVYFTFSIGGKNVGNFFYYYTTLHGKMH